MRLRHLMIALAVLVYSMPAFALQPAGQGAFVPVDAVPLADQLPAAPLLITAYAFVWLVVTVYVFSIWKRLNKVEDEMRTLAQKTRT